MKYTYNQALRQFCLQCKTKKTNCKRNDCNRYNAFKECMQKAKFFDKLMQDFLEINDKGCLRFRVGSALRRDAFVEELKEFLASVDVSETNVDAGDR